MRPVSPLLPGIAAANREALARLVAAEPVLVDCARAGDALGLGERAPLGCFTAALDGLARPYGVA
jgi:hypothetical protein